MRACVCMQRVVRRVVYDLLSKLKCFSYETMQCRRRIARVAFQAQGKLRDLCRQRLQKFISHCNFSVVLIHNRIILSFSCLPVLLIVLLAHLSTHLFPQGLKVRTKLQHKTGAANYSSAEPKNNTKKKKREKIDGERQH